MSRKAKTSHSAQVPPPLPRTDINVGIKIDAVVVRELVYKELPVSPGFRPGATDTSLDLNIAVAGTINIFENSKAELLLEVAILPDPALKPIDVKVRMSVLFSYDPATGGPADIQTWINRVGVIVLFPYIREVISNVTARGVYGQVLLDPIAVDALMGSQPPQE